MRDIYDIVQEEIFNKIDVNVTVESVTSLSNNRQILTLCRNKWARVGNYLTDIDNKQWKIESIAENGDITVIKPTGATNIVKRNVLSLKNPIYLFGTQITANNEYLMKGNDVRTKLPIVWLVESIREQEFTFKSQTERKSDVKFYFLDDNNPKQYLSKDYRKNVVTPMIGLKDEVIRVINTNLVFDDIDSYNTRPITRFGNEDEKGYFANILDENLSGVELTITLPILKSGNNCKC